MSIVWVLLLLWVVGVPVTLWVAITLYAAYLRLRGHVSRRESPAAGSRALVAGLAARTPRPPADHWRRRPAQLRLRSGSSGLGAFHGRR